jgi:hypothetical protein
VSGRLDEAALTRALERLFERHEVLRTVMRADETSDEQVVLDDWTVEVPVVDAAEDGLQGLLREHLHRPFDLRRDLILRATLFRLAPDDHVVLFQTHHIAFDAWAVEIFFRELNQLYADPEVALPELPSTYRNFAAWQRETLAGEHLEAENAFWHRYLAGAPTFLPLAPDRARPDADFLEAGRLLVELGAATAERLRQACADEGVTPYMVLLAAFATLLYRETGQDDILFGGPSSNRTRPEDEGVIGFFANTLVTRVQLAGNPTFRELLDRVRQSVLEAIEHEELPLDRVVEAIAPPRLAGVNPLFQVNFRTRVGTLPTLELAGATTAPVELELGLARFDLAFEAHVRDDGISGEFLYATALFDRARIERLAAAFESLLDAALADPARRLLAFDLPEEPSAAQSRPRIQGFRGTRRGASSGSRSRRPPAEPRR